MPGNEPSGGDCGKDRERRGPCTHCGHGPSSATGVRAAVRTAPGPQDQGRHRSVGPAILRDGGRMPCPRCRPLLLDRVAADVWSTRKLVDWACYITSETYCGLPAELVDERAAADSVFCPSVTFRRLAAEYRNSKGDQRHIRRVHSRTAPGSGGQRCCSGRRTPGVGSGLPLPVTPVHPRPLRTFSRCSRGTT